MWKQVRDALLLAHQRERRTALPRSRASGGAQGGGPPGGGGGFVMQGVGGCRFGPSSSVILTTTWLDDKVRVGRGSRGSRFVFLRGGYARSAGDLISLEG